jgi:hypothetical protein
MVRQQGIGDLCEYIDTSPLAFFFSRSVPIENAAAIEDRKI